MKKKLLIAAIAIVTVLAALSLVACNLVNVEGGDAKISDDYSEATTKQNVSSMRTTDGYSITYKLVTSSTDEESENIEEFLTLAAKGDVYYVKNADQAAQYIDLSSDEYAVIYVQNGENETWTKTINPYTNSYTKTEAKAELTALESYFVMYASLDEGLSKSTETVAGRECDKYTWGVSVNFIVSVNAKSECCVDKETGICMKWSASASASGIGVDSGSGSADFVCTAFSTSYTPTLPTGDQISETIDNTTPADDGEGEGEGDGGNGNGNGGDATTYSISGDVTAASAANRSRSVSTLVQNGVSISFRSFNEDCVYAAKGDVYYFKEGDYEWYYKFNENDYDMYSKSGRGAWTAQTIDYETSDSDWSSKSGAIAEMNATLKDYLYGGEDFEQTYFTKTTETRAEDSDKNAYVYTYAISSNTLTITVEKTYGIILEWTLSNGYDEEGFELTTLTTSNVTLTLPTVG